MNWDAIGAVGEVVGAAGVIVTLIYLAIQIRQNSDSVQSAAAQSVLVLLNETISIGATSPSNARIVLAGQNDFDSLETDEKLQFTLIMISFFRSFDLAYQHRRNGLITDSVWKGHYAQIRSLLGSESVRRIWDVRQNIFSEEFQQFIESIEAPASDVPRLLSMLLGTDHGETGNDA